MNFFSRHLPAVLMGAAVVMVQPQLAVALSPTQISDIAKEFTVLITGEGIGSGVIFERKGDTYFVITNQHVVDKDGRYEIQTPDGSRYPVYRSKEVPGLDIAILQFTSKKNYRLASLGNSDQMRQGMTVYVVGWGSVNDLSDKTNKSSYLTFAGIIERLLSKNLEQGYGLAYNNQAIPGMSGSPVLDENGRVVGINAARLDKNLTVQGTRLLAGWRLGIPINMVLTTRNRPVSSPVTAQQPSAIAFTTLRRTETLISSGRAKINGKDYQGAIADYNQALLINPNNPDAYFGRSKAYYYLKNYPAALEDVNKILQLSPKNANVYSNRGLLRYESGDKQAALADYNSAIQLDPKYASAYNNRGVLRYESGDKQAALADYNSAIQLDPKYAPAYTYRGILRKQSGDKQAALADFNSAIQLDPKNAKAYYHIGLIKYEQGDIQAAMRQFQTVINNSKLVQPQLALAVALYSKGEQERGLSMAQAALRLDKRYADVKFLKQQFWGDKLIADAKKLLENPKIKEIISRPSRSQ
ncbi:tetratricopeptide repeat protein [Brasilonema sp. CT11]|nr:tetratricopeptide repeat protein [Brasilonema sp. CT11]